jgi:hypothetical protein
VYKHFFMSEQKKQTVDNELLTKGGQPSSKDQQYKIMVDRQQIPVEKECLTGREILTLAGKLPVERFQLNMRIKGGKVSKVGYEQTVCLSEPGLEKFMTIPLDQTEGGR